jgi:hypothetical protein
MGLEPPAWMSSRSLLGTPPELSAFESELSVRGERPILGLDRFEYRRFALGNGKLSSMRSPGAPHYGVKRVAVVLCNRWYALELASGRLERGTVEGHTQPCAPADFPPEPAIADWLDRALARDGFSREPARGTFGAFLRAFPRSS